MKRTGLYFGTFNPIHIGHCVIAQHMLEYTDLDEVWFVVTPHNPHKKKNTLLDDRQRAAFNTPEGRKAFAFWTDLYRDGLLPREVVS
ncbi:MAG: adenylyltransferase/cytidyltransferase family protein, partial [Owenweeksia sp.]